MTSLSSTRCMVRYVRRDATMIKEADVVRDYERIQVQGLAVRARGIWPSRIDNLGTMEMEGGRSWFTTSGPGKQRITPSYTTMLKLGVHGFPIHASIHEDDVRDYFPQRKMKKWAGWRPLGDEAKSEFETKKKNIKKKIWRQYRRTLKNLQKKSAANHEVRQRHRSDENT